jgi:hypothetical protein
MGWFNKKKLKATPTTLADNLFQVFVEEEVRHSKYDAYHLDSSIAEPFQKKMELYRKATVQKALEDQKNQDDAYLPVLIEYERIIFSMGPEEAVRSGFFDLITRACDDLSELMKSENTKQLTWARNWLNELDYDETNPATLVLLATFFMDQYIAVRSALK